MDWRWSLALTVLNLTGLFAHARYAHLLKRRLGEIDRWVRGKNYKNVCIYVFDDDTQDLEFIETNVLSELENHSQVFIDQLSILKKAEYGRNVFVIDNYSPGLTGVELAAKIKIANSSNWVIIYSGANDIHVASEFINQTHRADKFVSKHGADTYIALKKAINEGIILISNQ